MGVFDVWGGSSGMLRQEGVSCHPVLVVDTCGSFLTPGTGRLGDNVFGAHLGGYSVP